MNSWTSYPSIFTLGHRALRGLLDGEVNVEEKIDGSQFSFGMVPLSDVDPNQARFELNGVKYGVKIRSKGAVMLPDAPEKMFTKAADTVKLLADKWLLHTGWTYRCEYLAKPAHNSLVYDRVPEGNLILFDVTTEDGGYLTYPEKVKEAQRIGLEVVPLLYTGRIEHIETFRKFFVTVSVLGGQAIEGVVVKPINYDLYGTDKKVLLGKFVSEAFKEVHRKSWGEANPTNRDIIGRIGDKYKTQGRWNKAIQHMREAGKLVDDVQDIGPIIKEIPFDVLKECEADIKDELFTYAWPHIRRMLTSGFAEYYKDQLLRKAFETEVSPEVNQGQELAPTESGKHETILGDTTVGESTLGQL